MVPTLTQYVQATQRLLHDPNAENWSTTDLGYYINEARTWLALESECIRFLYGQQGWTLTGTLTTSSTSVTNVSSIYGLVVGQTVTVAQSGTGIPSGTTIASIGGSSPASFTLSQAATVSGATTIYVSPTNQTIVNVENYAYPPQGSSLALPLGIDGIFQVKSVNCNWGAGTNTNQYTLLQLEWTRYQAYARQLGVNDQGQPVVWCNYNGNVYLRKIPWGSMGMQWDAICIPTQLTGATTDVEGLIYPWTECVKYFAAYLALLNAQRYDDANQMKARYTEFAQRAQSYRQRTMTPNVYLTV